MNASPDKIRCAKEGFTPTPDLRCAKRKISCANQVWGFTLIELLVVISIIGLLASIILASLNTARAKARDARRRTDLQQISKALEFYFDANNSYPTTSGAWWGNCSAYGSKGTSGSDGWVPNVAPTYISVLPLDPRPNGAGGCYLYNSNGTDYKLLAHLTTESVCPVPNTDTMFDPKRPNACTFAVYTPGFRDQ